MSENQIYKISYKPLPHGASGTEISFISGKPDLMKVFASKKERRLFVTDTNIACLESMKNFIESFGVTKPEETGRYVKDQNVLLIVKTGEENKNINTVLEIVKAALDASFSRKDIFTGIGGGVITDMTAFAASIYKRGARAEFVPTTLLAMVDAAVGGKTGCDFDEYKNMIGAFFPAEKLFVFPEFVQSLSEGQFRSGLAEAVKTAILFNRKMFDLFVSEKDKIRRRDEKIIFTLISGCVKAKAKVVEKDLMEKNIRMLLNLGHTFGHALETRAGLGKISHGDAVAWGMSRSAVLSRNLGLCTEEYKNQIQEILSSFGWETKAVPSVFQGPEQLLDAMRKDKKNSSNVIRVILQKNIEKCVIQEVPDSEILRALKED